MAATDVPAAPRCWLSLMSSEKWADVEDLCAELPCMLRSLPALFAFLQRTASCLWNKLWMKNTS